MKFESYGRLATINGQLMKMTNHALKRLYIKRTHLKISQCGWEEMVGHDRKSFGFNVFQPPRLHDILVRQWRFQNVAYTTVYVSLFTRGRWSPVRCVDAGIWPQFELAF
jgi:hypothetical protein